MVERALVRQESSSQGKGHEKSKTITSGNIYEMVDLDDESGSSEDARTTLCK